MSLPHPSERRWWNRAECLDLPHADELFFHEGLIEEAKSICFECPVRQACLFSAVTEEQAKPDEHLVGVRGGLSAKDRVLLRQMQRGDR